LYEHSDGKSDQFSHGNVNKTQMSCSYISAKIVIIGKGLRIPKYFYYDIIIQKEILAV